MHCLRSALEQEARDLSQQVASLLHEVQQLSAGGTQGQGSVLAIAAPPDGEVDADAVVSSRLVAFHNIQVVARCLGFMIVLYAVMHGLFFVYFVRIRLGQ